MLRRATILLSGMALLAGQYGVYRHSLAHLEHEVSAAGQGGQSAPPVGHEIEECVAYDAIASAAPSAGLRIPAVQPVSEVSAQPRRSCRSFFRIARNARGPPHLRSVV
jgi:hypothetical protein